MEVLGLIAGAAVAALIAPGALRAFAEAGWARPNYRDAVLPFPAGVIAVLAGILALGLLAVLHEIAGDVLREDWDGSPILFNASLGRPHHLTSHFSGDAVAPAGLFLGVAFLGLLDDLFNAAPRGWRGHGAAVLRGGFSTGALKAVGTLALTLAYFADTDSGAFELALAVAVVVLATNMFNLLDLRPGRSAKAFVLLGVGLLAGTGDWEPLRTVGPFAGALLILGIYDLREKAMLGDTGSNLLGALAGVWLVTALGTTGQLVAAGVLAALTIFGEFRSISATIDRLPPLRVLDSLGRPD